MKSNTEYHIDVHAYYSSGLVYSTTFVAHSVEELIEQKHNFIDTYKDTCDAVTFGMIKLIKYNYLNSLHECVLFVDEDKVENNYLTLDYWEERDLIVKGV